MARKTHHVVHSPSGGWNVKRGGAKRASGHYAPPFKQISDKFKKHLDSRTKLIVQTKRCHCTR